MPRIVGARLRAIFLTQNNADLMLIYADFFTGSRCDLIPAKKLLLPPMTLSDRKKICVNLLTESA
jgi:hypothetical protein